MFKIQCYQRYERKGVTADGQTGWGRQEKKIRLNRGTGGRNDVVETSTLAYDTLGCCSRKARPIGSAGRRAAEQNKNEETGSEIGKANSSRVPTVARS